MTPFLPPPCEVRPVAWEPGDPLYTPELCLSYSTPVTAVCCPPGCWCGAVERGGYAMRWTPEHPALRFSPDGLRIDEPVRGVA